MFFETKRVVLRTAVRDSDFYQDGDDKIVYSKLVRPEDVHDQKPYNPEN